MTSHHIVFSGETSKGTSVIIRYPLKEDLHEMWDVINELSQERTFITYQGEKISLQDEEEYLSSQLDKMLKGKTVQLLAFCDDVLVGVSSIDFLDRVEQHTGVFGITVIKSFRGKGIGALLMREVFRETAKVRPSLEIVTLWVFANNNLAIRMYEGFGFQEYGRLPRGIKLEHGYVDRISMYKSLKE
jgi:ribosomal protein S18 acetylase RimI-like enzyme